MIPGLPPYVSITFGLTTLATLILFYRIIKQSSAEGVRSKAGLVLAALIGWLLMQAILTLTGAYRATPSEPPKILLTGILPAMLLILFLSVSAKGRSFMDSLPLLHITYLNIVRIPVELVLLWLFMYKAVPQLMTFEGRNVDVLSGVTAPFVAYFGLQKGLIRGRLLLIWNVICLGLLLNIVINALLSAPTPVQQFAFDQPNIAIAYFPFSWLPTFIVPVVLFGHVVSIRQLASTELHRGNFY